MSVQISYKAAIFHAKTLPEEGTVEGYAAIINAFDLQIPLPYQIVLVSKKNNKNYSKDGWMVLPIRYKPIDTLYKQLIFALKYEGINLLVLKSLFQKLPQEEVLDILKNEPEGQYTFKIWFLYEWLTDDVLDLPNADTKIKYVELVDEKLQIALPEGEKSSRHRIINNLPGTKDFCPLISRTLKLNNFLSADLAQKNTLYVKKLHKDILQRASAFLLLKDSKASFTIEGESPKSKRAALWGQAIGQAGARDLSKEEFIRLQQQVIESNRFTKMGYRKQGGFVGDHDRVSGEPIPDHISARWQDIEKLMNGLVKTCNLLNNNPFDAVLAAAVIAFGFVVIHPFVDGNGRIHRYLIHHILARKQFSQQGIIFPISASILDHIDDYRTTLEAYSHPLLPFIEWKETEDHNIEVLNDTIDFYRYFDATKFAEFLFECVNDTINNIIPDEINYLLKYDEFKHYIDNEFEMPDKMIASLVRFLEQNNGRLSKRAREKEFKDLALNEVKAIENSFTSIFGSD